MITSSKIIVSAVLLFAAIGVQAQMACYETGLKEGKAVYAEAQKLQKSRKLYDAAMRYWEAGKRFQLAQDCRDKPVNHELAAWVNKCTQGMWDCGYKPSETEPSSASASAPGIVSIVPLHLDVSPVSWPFDAGGGSVDIAVSTDAGEWRVESCPPWCTAEKSGSRLRITCRPNSERSSRTGTVKIANRRTAEVSIVQAGREQVVEVVREPAAPDVPDHRSMQITDLRLAGAGGAAPRTGASALAAEISYSRLADDERTVKLDFKILTPEGKLVPGPSPDCTWSENVTLRDRQDGVIAAAGSGFDRSALAAPGIYRVEVWCSGARMYSAPFEVLRSAPAADAADDAARVQTAALPAPHLKAGFGVKAGLNMSGIAIGDSRTEFGSGGKTGFHAGAFLNLRFGYRNKSSKGRFALQPELLYSSQGRGDLSLGYINMPVMLKLYAGKFCFEAGPYAGLLLGVSSRTAHNGEDAVDIIGEQYGKIYVSDLKGGKDAGVAIGAGFESEHFSLGARYCPGMSDLAGNLPWKNRVFSISAGWKF